MAEYRRAFETLAASVTGMTEEVLESTFINRLKPDIKIEVRLLSPVGLGQLMEVAQKVEDRNSALKAIPAQKHTKESLAPNRWTEKKPVVFPTRTVTLGEKSIGLCREYTTRRMSDAEWQQRKEKGLCFRCNEKYTVGPQCKNRELRVLLVQEGEREDGEGGGLQEDDDPIDVAEKVELSLNSVVELTKSGTMKIKGTVKQKEVTILIDCGATHNFVLLELVKQLDLPITATTNYGVVMGSGEFVKGRGICRGVILEMQGLTIVEDFLPLGLGGTNMVLGMQWLCSLGSMKVNWKLLTMRFRLGEKVFILKGILDLTKQGLSLRAMVKALHKEGQGILVEPIPEIVDSKVMEEDPPAIIKQLLHRFSQILAELGGLPPERSIDHAIILKEGAELVNVRPYRYLHLQKNERKRC